jgi:putative transposase
MDKRIRHTSAQIDRMLMQADALAGEGRTQNDIAQSLGISVMTIHRWRKNRTASAVSHSELATSPALKGSEADKIIRIGELQAENARLRRLVTDLLLEKMRLEDEAGDTIASTDLSAFQMRRKFG